jgi:hypothetical protein
LASTIGLFLILGQQHVNQFVGSVDVTPLNAKSAASTGALIMIKSMIESRELGLLNPAPHFAPDWAL